MLPISNDICKKSFLYASKFINIII
jgi:hypothetical protein